MGWWSDIPKKIAKFLMDYLKSGEIETGEISGKPTIINIHNSDISNSKIILIPYNDISGNEQLQQILNEEFSSDSEDHSIMFVRKDQLEDIVPYNYSKLTDMQKEIVKEWKRNSYLPELYIGALVMSYRIINLEDRLTKYCDIPKHDEKQRLINIIQKLREKLYIKGYEHRRKIYNFARSGYIEGHFGAILGQLLAMDSYTAREKFPKIFEESLSYFEPAIWVDYDMNEHTLLDELRKRLKQDKPVQVTIYARGEDRITRVDNFINMCFQKCITGNLDFKIIPQKKELYTIGCIPAASFTVTNSMVKLD